MTRTSTDKAELLSMLAQLRPIEEWLSFERLMEIRRILREN